MLESSSNIFSDLFLGALEENCSEDGLSCSTRRERRIIIPGVYENAALSIEQQVPNLCCCVMLLRSSVEVVRFFNSLVRPQRVRDELVRRDHRE